MTNEEIRKLRIDWGFCPECGLVPDHPLNAYYHKGKCEIERSSLWRSGIDKKISGG